MGFITGGTGSTAEWGLKVYFKFRLSEPWLYLFLSVTDVGQFRWEARCEVGSSLCMYVPIASKELLRKPQDYHPYFNILILTSADVNRFLYLLDMRMWLTCQSLTKRHILLLRLPDLCCNVTVWLGLGKKTIWLGSGKPCGLGYNENPTNISSVMNVT